MKPIFNLRKAGLLMATATLLFTACKKDNNGQNNNPDPQPNGSTKIKKVSDGSSMLEFGYGTDGSVQTITLNDDFTTGGTLTTFSVTYDGAKKVSELKAADGTRIVAHYTGSELSSADMYDGNTLAFTTRYAYQNGVLQSATSSVNGLDALKFAFAYDGAGNVSKTTFYSINNTGQLAVSSHTDYTYDSKTNPMSAHKALFYLLLQNTPKNNVTKEMEYDQNNALTETTETTYTYNNQNLPQSASVKKTQPGKDAVSSNLVYSYQ